MKSDTGKIILQQRWCYCVNLELSVTEDMKPVWQTCCSMSAYVQNGEIIWRIAF